MTSAGLEQYAFRSQRALGISNSSPSYTLLEGFQPPEVFSRLYSYSPDGSKFAYALPDRVTIVESASGSVLLEIPIVNTVELEFSPKGTFLTTWERMVKREDGEQHKNLRLWSSATGEEVASFSQKAQEGWQIQFTTTESHAVRHVGGDVQVFDPSNWSAGIQSKLRVENLTSMSLSPFATPYVAVFVGEKKGAPGFVRIYSLIDVTAGPTCSRTFYKADSVTMKWNNAGTHLLVLTHADVDKTNKSYYGETNLLLLTAAGGFDCRVALDKEGPIHDFVWSPSSKEFGVVYGYIPSKAVLFDQKGNVTADLGSQPWNFISFNPQARLLILAGFGNLAGKVDIFDRRSLNKLCTMNAPNSSLCQWSPDGTKILTATLSPRLRVDNGVKLWHCSGTLLHVHMVDELYQASWISSTPGMTPAFPAQIPPAPPPSANVSVHEATTKQTPMKPAGAYRPPGARGLATPDIYKREDEGGLSHSPSNGALSRTSIAARLANNGANGQHGIRARYVPGAAPPSGSAEEESKKQKQKRQRAKKTAAQEAPPGLEAELLEIPAANLPDNGEVDAPLTPATPGMDGLDPMAKKVRNLSKKLKAIEELKERVMKGDKLEATQLKKIEGEKEIRAELKTLEGSGR